MQPIKDNYPEIKKYNTFSSKDAQNFMLKRPQEGPSLEEKTGALARDTVIAESLTSNNTPEKVAATAFWIQPKDLIDLLERYCPGYRSDPNLALAKLDCRQWNDLVDNIGTLGLDLSDTIALCQRMNQCPHKNGYKQLKNHFESLGLIEKIQGCGNIHGRIFLSSKITESCDWAVKGLREHFDRVGFLEEILACKNINKRLELCDAICSLLYWAADALRENFDKLGFMEDILECKDFNERLLLCNTLRKTCGYWFTAALNENFSKLGFVRDILACEDINDRIQLCDTFITNGYWAQKQLEENFDKFGFVEKIIEKKTPMARVELCNELTSQNNWMTACLAKNFSKLGFVKGILACEDAKDRLTLSLFLAAQGEWAATGLVTNFRELGLDETAVSERLKLIGVIASQFGPSNRILKIHISSLGLLDEIRGCGNNHDRFALCMQIASMHNSLAGALAERFYFLPALNEGSAAERFAFCKCIASQGKEVAKTLVANIKGYNLNGIDAMELIALWKEILEYGDKITAIDLVDNFRSLGVFSGSFLGQLTFYRGITQQDECMTTDFIIALDRLNTIPHSIKQRLILEFLVPPCHLLPQNFVSAYRAEDSTFPPALKPLISFLIIKEEDLKESDFQSVEDSLSQIENLSFLMPIYRKIKESGNARTPLTQWIAYTAAVLYNLEEEQILSICKSEILENIFSHRNPKDRFTFVRELSQIPHPALDEMPPNPMPQVKRSEAAKPVKWPRLAWILYKGMQNAGFTEQDATSIYKLISKQREFRDTTRFGHLVQLIFSIIEEGPYGTEDAEVIGKNIKEIFRKEVFAESGKKKEALRRDIHMISNDLQTLSVILKVFGKREFLRCLNGQVNYESFFLNKFQSLFEVGEIKDFSARYRETFGAFRDKIALYTYLRSVLKLGEGERGKVRKTLNDYVRAVLDGTFFQIRYDEQKSDHLKVVFGYGRGIKEAWLDKGAEESVLALETAEPTSQRDYKAFLRQKIFEDKHLEPALFPLLRDFLEGKINASKLETEQDDPITAFQIHAIDLCNNTISPEKFVESVWALNIPLGEFQNDMKALTSQKKSGSYVISESDDPCDLLLIGTEINGSCQRVDGSPELNKCLTAYLMNGEIIPIVVKEKGLPRIVARAMLRLMWDSQNQQPVLLLERVYSNVTDKAVVAAIQSRAVQKAQKMGVALVSKEVGTGASYHGSVEFLEGYAPFTYSDALQGSKVGAFEVEGCHVLSV